MKRFHLIKKNSDFQVVYRTGKSYANKLLAMYVTRRDEQETRIGIPISKEVGNSVVRYRVTRLIEESSRLNRVETETGSDTAAAARLAARDSDYKMIESAFVHLCGLHNIRKGLR